MRFVHGAMTFALAMGGILAVAEEITVVRAFPANKGPGWKPSIDVAGAIGSRHVVDFDVAHSVVHDKETGTVLERLTTREFWQQVEPAGTLVPIQNANDARIVYAPLTERWFACAAGTPEPDRFLAVSMTSDPLEPWRGAKLPLPPINPYMRMGIENTVSMSAPATATPISRSGRTATSSRKRTPSRAEGRF